MTRVRGRFDTTLTVPIVVDPSLSLNTLPQNGFSIDDGNVLLLALAIKPAIIDEYGALAAQALLTDIRVWIVRNIALKSNDLISPAKTDWLVPPEEEKNFEQILLKVVGRFVTATKQRIGQWDIDTRRPVYTYSYEYSYEDTSVGTYWPLASGSKKMPEYAKGLISFKFHGELTADIWKEVEKDVQAPVALPLYQELLYDAETFRRNMRYEPAVLFAAIAAEVILAKVCRKLLRTRRHLADDQIDERLRYWAIPRLIKEICKLDPSLNVRSTSLTISQSCETKLLTGKRSPLLGRKWTKLFQRWKTSNVNLQQSWKVDNSRLPKKRGVQRGITSVSAHPEPCRKT